MTSDNLMPFEIKHTVPHLKAFDCDEDIFGGQGHGSTFKQQNSFEKYPFTNFYTILVIHVKS